MIKVVFMRHGQSWWNLENRFTGWTDVDLSTRGVEEARTAGRILREHDYRFDMACTSLLKRAIRTLVYVQEELDEWWLPVVKDWRLNERHYGALQGQNKGEVREHFGDEQFQLWRRGVTVPPPPLHDEDPRHPRFDPRYRDLERYGFSGAESLQQTMARALDFWQDMALPRMREGTRLLIVAHGNTLRALVKHLDQISDSDIMALDIPTGLPLVYEFDARLRAREHYYLGDLKAFESAVDQGLDQGIY
jgi:2,3-bisphosphoglycerate-dependent phosphoglycerate mutase